MSNKSDKNDNGLGPNQGLVTLIQPVIGYMQQILSINPKVKHFDQFLENSLKINFEEMLDSHIYKLLNK